MRRWICSVILAVGLALGYAPGSAAAHPLGNFTVNQYSRVVVGREIIAVRYIVDMAEIPAFQERQIIDSDSDGQVSPNEQQAYLERQVPVLLNGLQLAHGTTVIELKPAGQELSFPEGQGGLVTLRLVLDLEGTPQETLQPEEIIYTVSNYPERLGWREIVVQAGNGIILNNSSAPTVDQSDELRTYPEDMLSSPPDVREARFGTVPGAASSTSAGPAEALGSPTLGRAADGFAELIAPGELTPAVMLGGLLLAFILGAGHALTPGHGKTVVAAYLVGARGTAMHALFLGITTTITHTAGVFLLGFITLAVSNYILPEQIYPWLEFLSGALVIVIGLALFRSRLAGVLRRNSTPDHTHDHTLGIDHEHGPDTHTHDHDYEIADWAAARARNKTTRSVSWRSLLALGISGGLLPCPSALVVLLSAIALHRVGYGLLLIVAFSAGLATVLTAIGLLLVYARGLFDHFPSSGRVMRVLPVASALLVTLAGCAITVGALAQTGIF